MKVAIAAGGTGGHLFPGLAVGEVLLADKHQVMLVVSEKEIDAVATEGRHEFRVEKVAGVGWPKKSPVALARFARKFFSGYRQCRTLFRDFRPDAVLGMGGFTSFGPILAGRRSGAATFVHDSNAIPGKANKLNARFCDAVLLGFDECRPFFPRSTCVVTGTPIRRQLMQRKDKAAALAGFGLKTDRRTLLVMGGSQAAHGLNVAVREILPLLKDEPVQFIHLAGQADEPMIREAYAAAGLPAFVASFWHRMEEAYSAADLAIARSGAASMTELSHFSLPSVLVPYPYAAEDHQALNARIFERAGAAVVLPESCLADRALHREIKGILDHPARLGEMSASAGKLAPTGAAEQVARVILEKCRP